MAFKSGRLASLDVTSAGTNMTLYQVPASKKAAVCVSIVNRSSGSAAKVRLALSAGTSPVNGDWLEYDFLLAPGEVIERTALMLADQSGTRDALVVQSDLANIISAVCYGIEEDQ